VRWLTPFSSIATSRGLKLGITDVPMAWGIRTNAIYTAQNYIYHWGA